MDTKEMLIEKNTEELSKKKPIYKKFWFWGVIAILLVAIATSIYFMFFNSVKPKLDENGKQAFLQERENQLETGFNKTIIDGYSGFVFQNRFGDCLNAHCINRAIERIRRDYNNKETDMAAKEQREPELIPHFSVHNLRHTFCTRFCENETNLKIIQEIMGHADISTTMNIYNEATKEKKIESFANLEGKIKIS